MSRLYETEFSPRRVIELSRENATVAHIVDSWQRGLFPTWEQAMTAGVCILAMQNESIIKESTKQVWFPPDERIEKMRQEMRDKTNSEHCS